MKVNMSSNIEVAKDMVAMLEIDASTKADIQRQLSYVRGEISELLAKYQECAAKQSVYAEICNGLLDRAVGIKNRGYDE